MQEMSDDVEVSHILEINVTARSYEYTDKT
jgi:hypothetical protein